MARTTGARRISETERRIIQLGAAQGMGARQLARQLGRHRSAIYRELAKLAADPQPVLPLTAGEGRDHA